jgi:hypothetical protein
MKHKKVAFFILFSIFYFLFSWQAAFASQVFFEQRGQVVDVFINTQGQAINAFEGKITFDGNLLEVQKIQDGASVVNFWITKPHYSNGEIIFSGITPGGYSSEAGLLFSAVVTARKSDSLMVSAKDLKFLKNDGLGTQDTVTVMPFTLVSAEIKEAPQMKDATLPENFKPLLSKDETVLDGKWFLAFSTQDKDSGMDHYEVKEGWWWAVSESPYVLKDQSLQSRVLIKAIDRAGNERIVSVDLPNHRYWYQSILIWVIMIILAGLFLAITVLSITWLKKRA